jgi:hypothetical protein
MAEPAITARLSVSEGLAHVRDVQRLAAQCRLN